MKYIYIRRLEDGALLDIPEDQWPMHEKRGGFKLVTVPQEELKQEEVPIESLKGPQCPVCGFQAKSDTGLRVHKRRKHG